LRAARIITAAAAIMVVVCGAFILNDEVILELAGLAPTLDPIGATQ
jgi:hypothetical protein